MSLAGFLLPVPNTPPMLCFQSDASSPQVHRTKEEEPRLIDKRALTERDICTKYITPALQRAGWDIATQILEEFPLTKGRIIVRGKLHTRGQNKRADYHRIFQQSDAVGLEH